MQQISTDTDERAPEAAPTANIIKKSHARKRPEGHIPRPSNAFILFRTDFVLKKRIPRSVEKDQTNISRIAGKVWQKMSSKEKQPWKLMAAREKHNHLLKYPEYMSPKRRSSMNGAASEEAQEDAFSRQPEDVANSLDTSMGSNHFSDIIAPWEPLIEHTHPGHGGDSFGPFELYEGNDNGNASLYTYCSKTFGNLEDFDITQYQQHAGTSSWIHGIPTQATVNISDTHASVDFYDPSAVSDARVNANINDPSCGITQYPLIYSNTPSEYPHTDIPMEVDTQDEFSYAWTYRVSAERFAPGAI